ncbi:MAG: hypothetical protein EBR34_04480 [Sphingomonadaceae bacterium]|nr:hypothetical protein [Sphingomonadaceae bacterium]
MAAACALAVPAQAQDIVVTGKSLKQTEADLKACLARKCSPDEDIKATLAHAENLFVSGDYKNSRAALKDSLGRNRKHGEAYPVPVSDLLRANSRIAEQMGEAKDFQLSVLDMRDTLKKGFGENDFRTLVAQIEVGDSRAKLGFPDDAERIYKDVEAKALAAGQPRVASFARLRLALQWRAKFDASPNTYNYEQLEKRLVQLIDQPLAQSSDFVLAAEVLRAKADRKAGSAASTEALIKRFAERGGASQPILLYAEPLQRMDLQKDLAENEPTLNTLTRLTALQARNQWADVGFWIGADGRVNDIEVLRSDGDQSWIKPVLANVQKRIYAPLKKDEGSAPGFYMIERYTLTARFESGNTGTRMRRREATPRIERVDLTPENYEAPSSKEAA